MWSKVEKAFINRSGKRESYDGEKIATVEVENIYELGKLVALRFLEWVRDNKNGVVALPTGRTPEFFIKTLERYKAQWTTDEVRAEVAAGGFGAFDFPDTSGLRFVMLDEFFPMLPTHRNSFCLYIRHFYCSILGVREENLLTFDLIGNGVLTTEQVELFAAKGVDLGLLTANPDTLADPQDKERREILLKVQGYCAEYERRLQAMGGIGFFLGGIGPDGHIAFNQEGCEHDSLTRLVSFNYPTAAAAAGDLGGIELARVKAAMTIGLGTITANPNVVAIIMAAGEGKAGVVRNSIEGKKCQEFPATCLHGIKNARFYITHGAANKLTARRAEMIASMNEDVVKWALDYLAGILPGEPHMIVPSADYILAESLVYDTSLTCNIPVHELTVQHLEALPQELRVTVPQWLKGNEMNFRVMKTIAARRLRDKIAGGLKAASPAGKSILHTGPHHDDVLLSYHPAMHEMLGRDPSPNSTGHSMLRSISNAAMGNRSRTSSEVSNSGTSSRATSGGSTANNAANAAAALQNSRLMGMSPVLGETFNENINHFAILTSGFHSVNDSFLWKHVQFIRKGDGKGPTSPYSRPYAFLELMVNEGQIGREYDDLMSEFYEGFLSKNEDMQDKVESIIFLRKVAEVWNLAATLAYPTLLKELKAKVDWLYEEYLMKHVPGDGIPKDIQLLKGCMRESEEDRVWACSRMPMSRVHHMRSKFYTDDFFTPMPSLADDAMPVANLIKARQPDVITVAFDPEGTGPDTHYKVLQVVAAGLRVSIARNDLVHCKNPVVWGYRNVWFEFTPSDSTLMIPGSAGDLQLMHDVFMASYTTQKAASFPSPYYDGPFSAWARQLLMKQNKMLRVLLGERYFNEHPDARVRCSAGFVFIKAMHADHFLREVEDLRTKFEMKQPN